MMIDLGDYKSPTPIERLEELINEWNALEFSMVKIDPETKQPEQNQPLFCKMRNIKVQILELLKIYPELGPVNLKKYGYNI